MSHHEEPTMQDVLEAVNTLSSEMERRLMKIEETMGAMATKQDLEDFKLELRTGFRNESLRTNLIVDKLHQKTIFNDHDVREVDALGMFPHRKTVI